MIDIFREWVKDREEIFLDVETVDTKQSIDFDVQSQKLVLIQVGDKHNQFLFDSEFLLLKEILESKVCIGHNIKYDYKILKKEGITLKRVKDTMIQEMVITASGAKPDGFYSLEQSHLRRVGSNPYSSQLSLFDPYIPKKLRNDFSILTDAHLQYARTDIICTHRLYEKQIELLKELELEGTANLENMYVIPLAEMEYTGFYLDQDRWLELEEYSGEKLAKELAKLNEMHTLPNWNSSKQVGQYFKSIGIPIEIVDFVKSDQSGETVYKDSVNRLVIQKYADKFPIIKQYLLYKDLQKLNSAYGIKFLKKVSKITNRVHSNYQQIVSTGRTSSSNPNLQNIITSSADFPEGIWWRECFKAEEGNVLVIADYGSQELKVAAAKSRDTNMISTLESGGDLHKVAAAGLFEIPIEDVVPTQRSQGKTANFAIIYGAGPSKLAEYFGVPIKKSKTMIEGYFKMFPKLKEYQENSFNNAINKGYILLDRTGRKYFLDDRISFLSALLNKGIHSTNRKDFKKEYNTLISSLFRKASNYPIQGESASMIKAAHILINRNFNRLGLDAKVIGLVHDELIVECRTEIAEQVRTIVENSMIASAKYFAKIKNLKAETKISPQWNK